MAVFFSGAHDAAVQGARPGAGVAEGRDPVVTRRADSRRTAVEASSLLVSRREQDRSAPPTAPRVLAPGPSLAVGRGGRDGVADRAERLRQVDAPAPDRRPGPRRRRASCGSATEPIAGPGAERGLMFQDPNLFPWLTVRRNIQAGLVARGVLRRAAPRGRRIPPPGRPRSVRRRLPAPALRRHGPAGGAGPGAGQPPQGPAARRAARGARPVHPHADAGRGPAALAGAAARRCCWSRTTSTRRST